MWVIISFTNKTKALDAQANQLLYCGKGGEAADSELDFCVAKINYFVSYDLMQSASLRASYYFMYLFDRHIGSLILSRMF